MDLGEVGASRSAAGHPENRRAKQGKGSAADLRSAKHLIRGVSYCARKILSNSGGPEIFGGEMPNLRLA